MAEDVFRILCTGDLHLGRRPSRVPVGKDALSVRAVWRDVVEAAQRRDVDAVVVTGDVVDQENKAFEAYGPLERGVRRLAEAGIPVVAVAGNHDYDTFPRLAESLDTETLHFLGRGGQWEAVTLGGEGTDAPRVRFAGWSFPDRYVTSSPLDSFDADALGLDDTVPALGVLHTEVGAPEGRYAPTQRSALARAPVAAWLMGHIHAPDAHREDGQLQLYTGSPQPLNPGEPGRHGAWLLDVSSTGTVNAQPLGGATLRYESVDVDAGDASAAEDVRASVLQALQNRLQSVLDEQPSLRHVSFRVNVGGRTRLQQAIETQARQMESDLRPSYESPAGHETTATVERVVVDTRPDYDLRELARGSDACGTLAQLLLDLDPEAPPDATGGNGEVDEALMQSVRQALQTVHTATGYEPLQRDPATGDPPSDDRVRRMLRQEGLRLLDELRGQRETE
jgi:DNA repair exonuclease SbcCD nuclease subunit